MFGYITLLLNVGGLAFAFPVYVVTVTSVTAGMVMKALACFVALTAGERPS